MTKWGALGCYTYPRRPDNIHSVRDYPYVCAVVLNWNGWQDTARCLASLRDSVGVDLHVVVVDNGSTDGSPKHLAPLLPTPWGELIRAGRNLGFTGGVNLGLRRAVERGADYAFLLNNDATVAPDGIVRLVTAAASHPDVGCAGPKIVWADEPGRLWSAGMSISWPRAAIHAHRDEPDDGRYDGRRLVQGLSACALLITRAALERVGLLDERYFAYYEDIDWCLRARQAGLRALYVGDACAAHRGSVTTNRGAGRSQSALANYYGARNGLLFMSTHAPRALRPLTVTVLGLKVLVAAARVLAGGVLLRRPVALSRARAMALGVRDAARGRFGER